MPTENPIPHGVLLPAPGVRVHIEGVTAPHRARYLAAGGWNGWVCPAFDYETALAIAEETEQQRVAAAHGLEDIIVVRPVTGERSFVTIGEYDARLSVELIRGFGICNEGESVGAHLYPIGSHAWTWEFYTPPCGVIECEVEAQHNHRDYAELGV